MGTGRFLIPCVLTLLFAQAAAPSETTDPVENVVLITVDTLRPDHLSVYGYERPTAAALESFAEDAVRFTRAYSTSSWTAPAAASLITSLDPYRHGVRNGAARYLLENGGHEVWYQETLPANTTTLAELLSEAGFASYGFSTNPHISKALGFAQGFEHFESFAVEAAEPAAGRVYTDAASTRRRLAPLLPSIRARERAFVWIHYLDPHAPYIARAPWIASYSGSEVLAGVAVPQVVTQPRFFRQRGLSAQQRRAALIALYDSEISFALKEIAGLLDDLGLGENTLYILTADHGEAFFEHGHHGHSESLYDPEVRIPLLMRFPERFGLRGVESDPVSILDIMPTILEATGIPPVGSLAGRSLLPLLRAEERDPNRVLHAELTRAARNLRSVRAERWKLIADLKRGKKWLFDTVADPAESRNLLAERPDVYARLEALLNERLEQERVATSKREIERKKLDPKTRDQLEALGYGE